MLAEVAKVGKRGSVVIPVKIRQELGLDEGQLLVMEVRDNCLVIRAAVAAPVESYSPRRKAVFLLNNAVTPSEYADARQRVVQMGLDPDAIPHERPDGTSDPRIP